MNCTDFCQNPDACAFSKAAGRCKAREGYEARPKPRNLLDEFFATIDPDELDRADKAARRQTEIERRYGYEDGRFMP
jgi:hypothetical protein